MLGFNILSNFFLQGRPARPMGPLVKDLESSIEKNQWKESETVNGD
jgi:hypothetical protein